MWIYWRIVRLEVCQLEVTIPNTNTCRFHATRYISLNRYASNNSPIISDLHFTSSLRALFGMPSKPRGLRLLFYRRFLAAHFWILEELPTSLDFSGGIAGGISLDYFQQKSRTRDPSGCEAPRHPIELYSRSPNGFMFAFKQSFLMQMYGGFYQWRCLSY